MTFIYQENMSTMGAKRSNNNIVKRKANPLQDRTNSKNVSIFSPNGKMQKTTKKRFKTTQPQAQPRLPSSKLFVPKKPTAIVDIDKDDHNDPLAATEYVEEVYQELRKREVKMSPQPNYLVSSQPKLQANFVCMVIDWLIEVQTRWGDVGEGISRETVYLATNLLHNFLAKSEVITTNELQLVGVTAFFIASKYEDIEPPLHSELVLMCGNAYIPQDIMDMEVRILKTLDYRVSAPTALNFLQRFLKAADATQETTLIANDILDGTLITSYNLLKFLPSQQAAAAVYIANRKTVNCKTTRYPRAPWNSTLEYHTGYKECEIMTVAQSILKAKIPENCNSVRNKYAQDSYGKISSKFASTFY